MFTHNLDTHVYQCLDSYMLTIKFDFNLNLAGRLGVHRWMHAHAEDAWTQGIRCIMYSLYTGKHSLYANGRMMCAVGKPCTPITAHHRTRIIHVNLHATWVSYYNACMSMRAHGCQET